MAITSSSSVPPASHRLPVPRHRRRASRARRLRHVPGLTGGDRAQPPPFAFDPAAIDALLLTHAHLDHCGRIPALTKAGYRGPIHATHATLDLAEIVLRDSAKLQSSSPSAGTGAGTEGRAGRGAGRSGGRVGGRGPEVETDDETLPERIRHARPEGKTEIRTPLYDEHDVDRAVELGRGCDYGDEIAVADGVTAVFHDAGHILGSAIIELRVTDAGNRRTIVFSGDLGRNDTPIVRDPTPITHADHVVIESTYGNREHGPHEAAIDSSWPRSARSPPRRACCSCRPSRSAAPRR